MNEALEDLEQLIEPTLALFSKGKNAKPAESIPDLLDREIFIHTHTPLTDVRSG